MTTDNQHNGLFQGSTSNYYCAQPNTYGNFFFLDKFPEVYLLVNKNRKKKYPEGFIYLSNNQEFELEIYNPSNSVLGVKITANGNAISDSILVIKPGQRIVLDRYLDTNDKFKFSSYNVSDSKESKEAIKNNGEITLTFYMENIVLPQIYYYNTNIGSTFTDLNNTVVTTTDVNNPYTINCNTINFFNNQDNEDNQLKKVETGRIEKSDNKSSQVFSNYNGSFNTYSCHSETIKLMPESQRPLEAKDLIKHCTNCGFKLKKDWKHCSDCGHKTNSLVIKETVLTIVNNDGSSVYKLTNYTSENIIPNNLYIMKFDSTDLLKHDLIQNKKSILLILLKNDYEIEIKDFIIQEENQKISITYTIL